MKELQGHTSGMAIPHFVIDAPGGGGKVPILSPDYLVSMEDGDVVLRNYEGNVYTYPEAPPSEDTATGDNGQGFPGSTSVGTMGERNGKGLGRP